MATLTLFEIQASRIEAGAGTLEQAFYSGINLSELNPMLPFQTVEGGSLSFGIEDELPDATPRGFNEANDDSLGNVRPMSEATFIYGKDIKTDIALINRFTMAHHMNQVSMYIKALRLRLERDFVKGGTSGARAAFEFQGLEQRLPKSGNSQVIANAAGNGGALSLNQLDTAIRAVDVPASDKILIMGQDMAQRLGQTVRNTSVAGSIDQRLDEFGRQAEFYNNVRIVKTDVDNKNVPIQGFTEENNTTSIYCVALGPGLVTMIQGRAMNGETGEMQDGLTVYNVGESTSTPHFITRLNWDIGMAIQNLRAASRLHNITNAAVAA